MIEMTEKRAGVLNYVKGDSGDKEWPAGTAVIKFLEDVKCIRFIGRSRKERGDVNNWRMEEAGLKALITHELDMKKKKHPESCIYCGRDTLSNSQICISCRPQCSSGNMLRISPGLVGGIDLNDPQRTGHMDFADAMIDPDGNGWPEED